MSTLSISRDSGYADHLRAYAVLVDNHKIGEIRNGETKEFSLSPGEHTISIKIDWCGTKTLNFTATEGSILSFNVKSNLREFRLFLSIWYAIFAHDSYLILEPV